MSTRPQKMQGGAAPAQERAGGLDWGNLRFFLELVRTGRCDIGIMRAVSTSSDVVAVTLGRQEMVVLFPAHLAPKRASVPVPEMAPPAALFTVAVPALVPNAPPEMVPVFAVT